MCAHAAHGQGEAFDVADHTPRLGGTETLPHKVIRNWENNVIRNWENIDFISVTHNVSAGDITSSLSTGTWGQNVRCETATETESRGFGAFGTDPRAQGNDNNNECHSYGYDTQGKRNCVAM